MLTASAIFQSTNSSKAGRELNYTMEVRWRQFDTRYSRYNRVTVEYRCTDTVKKLQNKNIHKYKLQMIYFKNYTGTPTHLLEFLEVVYRAFK